MSRKRRQDEMEAPIARPHAEDKIEIASIVNKRLSSVDVEDVAEAMSSLIQLLHSNNNTNADENRKTAVRHGALLAIVQAMYRHENAATIPGAGTASLVNICCCNIDNYKPEIIEGASLKCVIWVMGRQLGDFFLQSNGCILIGNLWMDPSVRKSIFDQGGLKAVVSAMKNCKQSESVQRTGCCALAKLLPDKSPTWAKAATDSGCIELVISAMDNHPNQAEIQKSGCEFFSRLSKAHDDYRNMVLEAQGLAPVVQALRIHKHDAQVKLAARKAFDAN